MKGLQNLEGPIGRIMDRDLFLYLLDLEIKRARRYQNFISILFLRINPISNDGNSWSMDICRETLGDLLSVEIRESDILGFLDENCLGVLLPYADIYMGEKAKERLMEILKYFDFKRVGYDITVDQFCFPANSADPEDLLNKLHGFKGSDEKGEKHEKKYF